MDNETATAILGSVRARRKAAAEADGFAGAVQDMAAAQLKSDALADVRNLGLAGLGAGAAGAGLAGLINLLRRTGPKKPRSGPAMLPLPYPVEPAAMPTRLKAGGFLAGDAAASKSGIPWYGPAMLAAGLGGIGLGWKGVDALLARRRKRETDSELDSARREFHDALLAQYDAPIKVHPDLAAAAPTSLAKAAAALDLAFDRFAAALAAPPAEKRAFDWADAGGAALGGYGMYAGLSGLLTGTFVYDKAKKRSQRAVLEKALQRRQRRQFMQQPTEIYAVPEPVRSAPPRPAFRQEMRSLAAPTPEPTPEEVSP
jgi:hypothetical protein